MYPSNGSLLEHRVEVLFTKRRGKPLGELIAVGDFWEFPWETLNPNIRTADCDGTAILLCSMLRNFIDDTRVFVAIGNLYNGKGIGHAWVNYKYEDTWYILETTLNVLPKELWKPQQLYAEKYDLSYLFNDKKIILVKELNILESCTDRDVCVASMWR